MTAARLRLEQAAPEEYEALVPVLSEADESDERIRTQLRKPDRVSYRALLADQLIGAATMHWQPSESELLYIVILPRWRGQGHGKTLITNLLTEATRRAVASVCVGTANSSLDNIAFYQRCGFRMHHVRRDYFAYIQPPITEHGITMRDMLVFTWTPGVVIGARSG